MKKLLLLLFAALVMFFWILPVNAKTLDVATEYKDTIGQYIQVYQSGDGYLSMHDAIDAFRNGHFSLSDNPVINFGVDSKPVWLALQISNSGRITMHRNLLIENAWLDKIDVYYFQQEQLINSYHTGDSLLFSERPLNRRFFVMGHDFTQGETTVLIRVESADAMVLPIYLLTNLNNRRSFYKFVQPIWAMSLRSKSNTSVIVLDIDHFKLFNDNYGHALGDRVLVQLSETLQKEARSGDILARWGGEEFLIFLSEMRLTDAVAIAERVRKKIFIIQIATDKDEKLSFTASLGVASTLDGKVSLDDLISQADQQLYRAKKQGRNCVCSESSG